MNALFMGLPILNPRLSLRHNAHPAHFVVSTYLVFIFLDWIPRLVRIEPLHLLKFIKCVGSKILFVDDAILTDGEGSYSRRRVFGRCGNQSKAANHHAFHDKIHFTKGSRRSLSFENFKEISG